VNRLDQETEKKRGPTRAVEPFKKKKKKWVWNGVHSAS
jgi:hypothetical protein